MQGKLFQRCTHFLYCNVLSLGRKVNTRQMSQTDMESIFTNIIYEIFWSKEANLNFFKIKKIKCFYPPRGYQRNTNASILVYKFRPERTGFNMYRVRRVYTTAIDFLHQYLGDVYLFQNDMPNMSEKKLLIVKIRKTDRKS